MRIQLVEKIPDNIRCIAPLDIAPYPTAALEQTANRETRNVSIDVAEAEHRN
jgi:hypothetical protein